MLLFVQGKTAFQAEIDATCELIDFYRYAVEAANDMYWTQPPHNPKGVWNRLEYRGLEGFVASISPFNFTAIGMCMVICNYMYMYMCM